MYTNLNLNATFRIGLTTKLDIDKVVLTYRVIWKYILKSVKPRSNLLLKFMKNFAIVHLPIKSTLSFTYKCHQKLDQNKTGN